MLHINDLPSSLSTDMTTELYRPILESIELFAGVTDAFIASICQALKLSVYLPGVRIAMAPAERWQTSRPAPNVPLLFGRGSLALPILGAWGPCGLESTGVPRCALQASTSSRPVRCARICTSATRARSRSSIRTG